MLSFSAKISWTKKQKERKSYLGPCASPNSNWKKNKKNFSFPFLFFSQNYWKNPIIVWNLCAVFELHIFVVGWRWWLCGVLMGMWDWILQDRRQVEADALVKRWFFYFLKKDFFIFSFKLGVDWLLGFNSVLTKLIKIKFWRKCDQVN